jgi:integrase
MPKKAHFPRVNKVRWRDTIHYYHRPTGIKLPSDYGSAAFAKAWAEAEGRRGRPDLVLSDPRSYAGLVTAFQKSDEWKRLSDHTRADYSKLATWMHNQGAGPKRAADLTQDRCEKLLDRAVRDLGWRRGLYVLQFNRRLYNWVLERSERKKQWGDANPWVDLKNPSRPPGAPKANRPWKPDELFEVLFEAPTGLRRAYVLGASGMDGSTIIQRRWDEYRDGGFAIERGKTGEESWIMVPPILRYLLEEEDKPSEFIVTNQHGKPFARANTLQTRSSDFLHGMASAGKVGSGLTLHGLRHTAGKVIADGGGTLRAIQGALQHKSTRMALYYSEHADKKRALLSAADSFAGFFDTGTKHARQDDQTN